MDRIHTFEDIVGHQWIVSYLRGRLSTNTFPHVLLLSGAEGLGKTSLADLCAYNLAYPEGNLPAKLMLIDEHKSTDRVKRFVMSVDGGKDAAREVYEEMQPHLGDYNKVIICDECHGLSGPAQDLFLDALEYITDNTYVIMSTTAPEVLKPTLKSRLVHLQLKPLKESEAVALLAREISKRHLTIPPASSILHTIANWADCKPRNMLQVLNAFEENATITTEDIQNITGTLDVSEVITLLATLGGSVVTGLNMISDMDISNSIVYMTAEILKVKYGQTSFKLDRGATIDVREQLAKVPTENIENFLFLITEDSTLSREKLIHAYLGSHVNFQTLVKQTTKEQLALESQQKFDSSLAEEISPIMQASAPPTFEELIANAPKLEDI